MESMTDEEIRKKLARLEKIDRSSKERLKRYLDKKRKEGFRTISAIVSGETYELIDNERSRAALTGKTLSVSDIIEHAINSVYKNPVKENVALTPPEPDVPDNLISRITDMKSQNISYAEMANILNAEGLRTKKGKAFTRANIETMYRRR